MEAVQTAKRYGKAIQSHNKASGEFLTNHFELLMLQHGRAFSAYEFRRKYVCDNEMQYSITAEGIFTVLGKLMRNVNFVKS